jgi:uncharacterized protein
MEALAWIALILFSFLGLLGVVLPGLPGTILLFVGALIHKILLPAILSWWVVAICAVGALLAWMIDLLGSAAGAKWGGASKYGIGFAVLGAVVGLFFAPIGILVGPLLGAFLGEWLVARRSLEQATRSSAGTGIGILVSTVLRLFLTVALLAALVIDCFLV